MKTLKLCMVVGLMLSISSTAWAVSVPNVDNGWVFWLSNDKSNGTSYDADTTGTWTRNNPEDNFTGPGSLNTTKSPDAWEFDPDGTPNSGDEWTEDTWGVLGVQELRRGEEVTPPTDVAPGSGTYYQWTTDSDTGLVGMFHGGWDHEVEITDPVDPDGFIVSSRNVNFDLWAVDTSKILREENGSETTDFFGPDFEVGRRTHVDRYADWIDDTDGTKVHLLRAVSNSFVFSGGLTSTNNFGGTNDSYWNIDPDFGDGSGTAGNPLWNSTWGGLGKLVDANLTGDLADPSTYEFADFWTDFDIDPTGTRLWMASSTDDGGGYVVPEPLTMIGICMGIGGLGGYIRKRRTA